MNLPSGNRFQSFRTGCKCLSSKGFGAERFSSAREVTTYGYERPSKSKVSGPGLGKLAGSRENPQEAGRRQNRVHTETLKSPRR